MLLLALPACLQAAQEVPPDAGIEPGVADSGVFDAGVRDAGLSDAGASDGGCVDAQCPPHQACVVTDGGPAACQFIVYTCSTDSDCCPGQVCPPDRLRCFDRFVACQSDTDCSSNDDTVCGTYTDSWGTSTRCQPRACDGGACPAGQRCFVGECRATTPCSGSCPPGQACVTATDFCQPYDAPSGRPASACPMSCPAGSIATFADPRDRWDRCDLARVRCVCELFP